MCSTGLSPTLLGKSFPVSRLTSTRLIKRKGSKGHNVYPIVDWKANPLPPKSGLRRLISVVQDQF